MKRTWMLRAAGILCIIAGVPIVVIPGILVALSVGALITPTPHGDVSVLLPIFFGTPAIILGTFAIVGGICALRRRIWGLALAGSIAALIAPVIPMAVLLVIASWPARSPVIFAILLSSPLGIPGILAIIFVIKGKGEFKAKALVSALYREESADAYYKRGDAYDETGEYDKAITSYSKAIELDPNHALSYYNRGCAYGEIGEYEKAIADFNKTVELDPNDANAYYNRGLAYLKKDEVPKAVRDLEKCIRLSTDPELTKAAQQALLETRNSP